MRSALGTFWRILARRWPVLAAWVLGCEAAHYLLIHAAGWAGSYGVIGGLLLLPLAVLARLVAFVAMFLIVRADLPGSGPQTALSLRGFADAVSAAIVPFLVFYSAWGLLERDRNEYFGIAADLVVKRSLGDPAAIGEALGYRVLGVVPVAVLVGALVLRTLAAAFAHRLPRWADVVAVYVEIVWVTMLVLFVQAGVDNAFAWISTRAGAVWFTNLSDGIAASVPWLGALSDAVGGLWGLVSTVVLLPAAWLAIVGTIYGERDEPARTLEPPRRGRALWQVVGKRVEDVVVAFRLVWRAGGAAVGVYLLAFAVWSWLYAVAQIVVPRLFGAQPQEFWLAFGGLIGVLLLAVVQPAQVVMIATAYDLFRREALAPDPLGEREPDGLHAEGHAGDLDMQRGADVVGNQEPDGDGRRTLV